MSDSSSQRIVGFSLVSGISGHATWGERLKVDRPNKVFSLQIILTYIGAQIWFRSRFCVFGRISNFNSSLMIFDRDVKSIDSRWPLLKYGDLYRPHLLEQKVKRQNPSILYYSQYYYLQTSKSCRLLCNITTNSGKERRTGRKESRERNQPCAVQGRSMTRRSDDRPFARQFSSLWRKRKEMGQGGFHK